MILLNYFFLYSIAFKLKAVQHLTITPQELPYISSTLIIIYPISNF